MLGENAQVGPIGVPPTHPRFWSPADASLQGAGGMFQPRGMEEGAPRPAQWQRFSAVPPPLQSWLTKAMMYVGKALTFIDGLEVDDLTPEVLTRLIYFSQRLEDVVHLLKSPYLDNANSPTLGLERMQNLLHLEEFGTIFRVNINMTDANKLDPTGNLGTAFKCMVIEWLNREYGHRRVSFNPEGTSFLVINVLPRELHCSLGRFEREILQRLRSKKVAERFGYDTKLLSDRVENGRIFKYGFKPRAMGMYMTVDARDLRPKAVVATGDKAEIKKLQISIISRIERSLRRLAVGTTLAEKDSASIGLAGGMLVYDSEDLPKEGEEGYHILEGGLHMGWGFIPATRYISPAIGVAQNDDPFVRHPRPAHDFGVLDHPVREGNRGGVLQILQQEIRDLAEEQDRGQRQVALSELKATARHFGALASSIANSARSNVRNEIFVKYKQAVHLNEDGPPVADAYFMEGLSLFKEDKIHLVLVELDSFRAFSMMYPTDETDSNFWGVFDQFLYASYEMELGQITMTQVAGDLAGIAVPTVDIYGDPVDIGAYVALVKAKIEKAYGDRLFQDYEKVEVPSGRGHKVERWPLWKKNGIIFAAPKKPEGAEPFIRSLSLTGVATMIERPATRGDANAIYTMIDRMAQRVEGLKKENRPFKNGFETMTFESRPEEDILTPRPSGLFETGDEQPEAGEFDADADDFEIPGMTGQVSVSNTPRVAVR